MKRSASSALTLLALAACTGEPRAPGLPPAGSKGEGGSSAAPAAGASLQPAAGVGADTDTDIPAFSREGDSDAPTDPGSPWAVVDVPAGTCVESDAAARTLLAADAYGITFDRAGRVADRHFAFDSASLAFVTFAAELAQPGDGALASPAVYADVVALSGDDSSLRALELDAAGKLVVSRFDAWGARAGASFELDATNTTHHALLATGERALAVWNVAGKLRGRLLGADSPQGAAFDYGGGSCGDHGCQPVLLEAPGRFVLLWGRVLHDGTFGISFSVIDPDGAVLLTKPVLASFAEHRLVDAALLADESVALLIAEGFPSRGALLQRLDSLGNATEPAQRLLGAVEPWAIASNGASLAIVARSATDRAMLRTVSASNTASEHWTCLDDNLAGEAFAPRAVVFEAEDGYGLVMRRLDGSSAFAMTAVP